MSRQTTTGLVLSALLAVVPPQLRAQQVEQSVSIVSTDVASQVSAFSYVEGPKSKLTFRGTPLTPAAEGKVNVEYQRGRSEVDADVKRLPDPWALGPYTTYVLWAVTPDGRATNLGVVETSGGKGGLKTSYSGSQFALIVTAEPHFAVTSPSTAVVLINVPERVKGTQTKVTSLAERANYSGLAPITIDRKTAPIELVAARYAVAIAAAAGAEQYAQAAYQAAQDKLQAAETAQADRKSSVRKTAPRLAREAVQAGEDARRAGMAGRAAAEAEQKRIAAAEVAAAAAAAEERTRAQALSSEAAREELRARLTRVLPTRTTERGLVSEIGGVQFAVGTANLTARARESLANFAGVVSSYPSLKYVIEGHTDSTGSDAANRELSLKRALAVRDYLIASGIPASATDVAGLGSSMPIADNSTSDGRSRNRRVEIVVSGPPL
jgi:outer membrane protein OmpA-like peptidoglycan-associated protein